MNHYSIVYCFLLLSTSIKASFQDAKQYYKKHILQEKLKVLVLNPAFYGTVEDPYYKMTKHIKIYNYVYDNDDNIDAFIKNKSINLIITDNDFVTCKKNELSNKYFNKYNIDQVHCKYLQNKKSLRSYLSQFDEINNVKHELLINDDTIIDKIKKIPFNSFIVKPTCGAGSGGVFHLHKNQNKIINLDKFKEQRHDNIYIKDVCNTYIAEEFINGTEHNLDLSIFKDEVYFWHVSDDSIDMINFQDIQTRFPSKLKNPQKLNMLEQAKAILKRLNISSGVYHFEFKYDKDKAYLIELNPRCPGGNYVNYISKLYGSDLDYDDLLIALKRRPFKNKKA